MAVVTEERFVLEADGGRTYTFDPHRAGEVRVAFRGPRHTNEATVTAEEARILWRRLLRQGYRLRRF